MINISEKEAREWGILPAKTKPTEFQKFRSKMAKQLLKKSVMSIFSGSVGFAVGFAASHIHYLK